MGSSVVRAGAGLRGRRIADAAAAAACLAPGLARMRREALRVLHLDHRHRVIGVRLHYSRARDGIDFPLRTIIADALALNSAGIVLAHNHPSGDPSPSKADIAATIRLAEVASRLDITVHDHLIFARNGVRSLKALGIV